MSGRIVTDWAGASKAGESFKNKLANIGVIYRELDKYHMSREDAKIYIDSKFNPHVLESLRLVQEQKQQQEEQEADIAKAARSSAQPEEAPPQPQQEVPPLRNETPLNTMLDWALAYAKAGYPVLPLQHDCPPTCNDPDCKEPKKPWLNPRMQRRLSWTDATINPDQIKVWWNEQPDANIGNATFEIVVVDLDTHKKEANGILAFEKFKGANEWTDTPTQHTPGGVGGNHLFFNRPEGVEFPAKVLEADPKTGELVETGIEIKSKGYVVVAPSIVHGKPYRWAEGYNLLDKKPADMPPWLLELTTKPTSGGTSQRSVVELSEEDRQLVLEALKFIPADDRDLWIKIGLILKDYGFDYDVFDEWSQKSYKYDAADCKRVWDSFNCDGSRERAFINTLFWYAQQGGFKIPQSRYAPTDAAFTPEMGDSQIDPQEHAQMATQPPKSTPQRDVLIRFAKEAEFWHDLTGTAYATIKLEGHQEHHKLRSKGFKNWLMRLYYEKRRSAPSSQAIEDSLKALEARACFDGRQYQPYIRVAETNGKMYLDLVNDQWEVVEIDNEGWRVIDTAPVRFTRAPGMLPLPMPRQCGPEILTRLKDLLGLKSDQMWALALSVPFICLRFDIPYPVVLITGEQGSGKTLFAAIMRSIVDPNTLLLRSKPRNEQDLLIAAINGHVIGFDNLSGISQELSDQICRLSTGAGNSFREHYENDSQVIFNVKKPVITTSIADVAAAYPDLLSRSLLIHLDRLPDASRKTEKRVLSEFNEIHPEVLGALLSAASCALRYLPSTKLEQTPRLADAALWVVAGESRLGLLPQQFMTAYAANSRLAAELALEASPLAQLIFSLAKPWRGTADALLQQLRVAYIHNWQSLPKTPKTLSDNLRRIEPPLRQLGISVVRHQRSNDERLLEILQSI